MTNVGKNLNVFICIACFARLKLSCLKFDEYLTAILKLIKERFYLLLLLVLLLIYCILELCVEQIGCSTSNYRYPHKPPEPTPPPKHERGGWVAPEPAKLTYMSLPGR